MSADLPVGDNACSAVVTSQIYLGDHQRLLTEIGNGHRVTVKVPVGIDAAVGASIFLCWNAADCRAFPASVTVEALLEQET